MFQDIKAIIGVVILIVIVIPLLYFGPIIIWAGIGWVCIKIKEIITGKKDE